MLSSVKVIEQGWTGRVEQEGELGELDWEKLHQENGSETWENLSDLRDFLPWS
jgi:hypothetical protein